MTESLDSAPAPDIPAAWRERIALARKYACQGPRYTSYPTAPQFTEDFPLARYLDWQAGQRAGSEPLSIYVHLPFCHDICYYCACNKVVTRRSGVAREYLERLGREIRLQGELVGDQRPVTQMHWGGGTPTYLDAGEITELMHQLASSFRLLDRGAREYSIEIDPRTVDPGAIALLKGVGFNRVSLGIQDFDPRVQRAINRIQTEEDVAVLVDGIRRHGFQSLSFDLIYGLPFQDRRSMAETLRKVVALRPDRIACYNYAHLPERFKPQRSIDRLTLPEPEEKLLLAELITATLQDAGYRHIGMDHYILPGDELARAQHDGRLQRNFQGYSMHLADDLLGLGVSAISQLGDFYLANARDLDDYYRRIDAGELALTRGCEASGEDRLRRHVIMSLICELALDIGDCEARFGVDFQHHFRRELAALGELHADGLVVVGDRAIRVTEAGRPFLRNICMPFDAYLQTPQATAARRFSATV